MINAIIKDDDGDLVLILGLSDIDLKMLKGGFPLHFDSGALEFKVGILYGPTDDDIIKQLRTKKIGPMKGITK